LLKGKPGDGGKLGECSGASLPLLHSKNLLTEEGPLAYKDAQEVVNVVHNAGLAQLVARLKPLIVVKG
jgi:RNA-splicing ligase RtcB